MSFTSNPVMKPQKQGKIGKLCVCFVGTHHWTTRIEKVLCFMRIQLPIYSTPLNSPQLSVIDSKDPALETVLLMGLKGSVMLNAYNMNRCIS